ncbi:MAG: MFS transporter, partial [Methanoregula sp.]
VSSSPCRYSSSPQQNLSFCRLADRIDKRLQILCGILVLGCAVAAIPAGQTFYEFLVISTVLGCGMALSTVATSAYIADLARRENVGASMGALSATMDIGHAAGPLCSGIIIMQCGYLIGFGASLFLALASAVCFAVSVRSAGE